MYRTLHSFIPWNAQFHPMKLTVSSYETHSFILWNSQFHPVKLTVSSRDLFLETIYALNIRRLEESSNIQDCSSAAHRRHQVTCRTLALNKSTRVVTISCCNHDGKQNEVDTLFADWELSGGRAKPIGMAHLCTGESQRRHTARPAKGNAAILL